MRDKHDKIPFEGDSGFYNEAVVRGLELGLNILWALARHVRCTRSISWLTEAELRRRLGLLKQAVDVSKDFGYGGANSNI